MSVQAFSFVIEHSRHGGNELLLLMMIANHAHADGTGAHPSTATLARECRITDRQVRRTLRILEASGELVIFRSQGRRPHEYAVPMGEANREAIDGLRQEHHPSVDTEEAELPNPDNMSGFEDEPTRTSEAANPDISGQPTRTSEAANPDISGHPPTPPYKEEPYEPSYEPSGKEGESTAERSSPAGTRETPDASSPLSPSRPDPEPDPLAFAPPRNGALPPAVRAWFRVAGFAPDRLLWPQLTQALGADPTPIDELRLRECYTAWIARGYRRQNVAGVLEWFMNGSDDAGIKGRVSTIEDDEDEDRCDRCRATSGMLLRRDESGKRTARRCDHEPAMEA